MPSAIRDLYNSAESNVAMGIFPEISRAWIVVDSNLYLWNYLNGAERVSGGAETTAYIFSLSSQGPDPRSTPSPRPRRRFKAYEELGQLIVTVALARPKPGSFTSEQGGRDPEWLLLVSTPVQARLLAA